MSLFTALRAYHIFYGQYNKKLAESPKKHRELTRAVKSSSCWVHYNPATKMFKTRSRDGQLVVGDTTDLSNKEVVKHSSKRWADETANHPTNKADYAGFISVEVLENTTFELAP